MKTLTKGKMWCFAIGQFGWSLLSALITNWLVYFYAPDQTAIAAGQTLFIPQGRVIFGVATIIGGIAALGRIFDAVTDPLIANLSDRSKNPRGRHIPFMQRIAPFFAMITVLVYWTPFAGQSALSGVWLLAALLLFYLFMTTYCTPYNALISELGTTQDSRISISTYISCTFLFGSAVGYAAPYIWNALAPSFGRVTAIRLTFAILSAVGLVALLVPTFTIREKDYVTAVPTNDNAFASLAKTFRNRDFRVFVGSDVLYFIALTIFQTGLPFFITSLMGLAETYNTTLYILMTLLSFACYPLVNALARRLQKKRLVLLGFCGLAVVYVITALSGLLGVRGSVPGVIGAVFGNAWGLAIILLAAFPMAILGILPQAIVADIAQADAIVTGENREGMFFAARTFAFKMGQSVSMLLFTSFASIRPETGLGYRIAAVTAMAICLFGAVVLSRYNEKKVLQIILPADRT
ncbi:MFS transporter [Lachnoclostridium sp. Marseille-P6806]|uniref:MFS transporter n=1 Tax=Lachnoclostridium sp. Marseille-P6806 TaxID=2364793 RepID=UPI001030DDAC|nr:MFS transporter [Lachnoclostridium sp. Marseille-P6806]